MNELREKVEKLIQVESEEDTIFQLKNNYPQKEARELLLYASRMASHAIVNTQGKRRELLINLSKALSDYCFYEMEGK